MSVFTFLYLGLQVVLHTPLWGASVGGGGSAYAALVVGGLGALGALTGRWMARAAAVGSLRLVGRSGRVPVLQVSSPAARLMRQVTHLNDVERAWIK